MKISLTPVRSDEQLEVSREGDTLILNGEPFDFSPLAPGASLPAEAIASEWFVGHVERVGGELELTIRLPHAANAPESTRFPVPITVTADGPVELPAYDSPAQEPEPEAAE